ncbi:tyrosine-type recombinase/integrase [Nesterenkonia rhizosphaerae]
MDNSGKPKPIPLMWQPDYDAWQSWLIAAGKSRGTVKMRGNQLARLARGFVDRNPWSLTLDELTQWIAEQGWAADTLRGHRAAFRSFYSWGMATGRTQLNPTEGLPSARAPRPIPRPAPEDVTEQAIAEADERGRAMIIAGRYGGLRSCEIARIHINDFVEDLDGWSLVAHGKGNKERMVPLDDDIAEMLIRRCRENGGWCFPGRVEGHLSPAYVSKLLSRALGPDWTGHTLRHRYGSAAYAGTRDIRAVQELLGHASPSTTQIYTAVPSGALRKAAKAARLARHNSSPFPHHQNLAAAA